jgi:uncharacterized membrane protein YphA (DoxX/SURF4 family)
MMTPIATSRINDSLMLVSRILATTAIVRYGVAKFFDPTLFIDNPATIGFMRFFCGGAVAPVWLADVNAAFKTGAGICVMAGLRARWAAALLILWLVVLTIFGHPFWAQSGRGDAAAPVQEAGRQPPPAQVRTCIARTSGPGVATGFPLQPSPSIAPQSRPDAIIS